MSQSKIKKLVSILMESPFYESLPEKQRHSLMARLSKSYPFIFEEEDEETEVGYESSWTEIFHNN